MMLKQPSPSEQPGIPIRSLPRGSACLSPSGTSSGMPLARRSSTAPRSASVTFGSEPSRSRGVLTGSAGSNGTVHGMPAAARRDHVSRHSTAPREPMSARPSQAASTAHACSRSGAALAVQPCTTASLASSAERLRLALKTAFIVSIVKPAGPSPSVPASRCSACTSPSRVRSSRAVPSGPMMRGKPERRKRALGSQ